MVMRNLLLWYTNRPEAEFYGDFFFHARSLPFPLPVFSKIYFSYAMVGNISMYVVGLCKSCFLSFSQNPNFFPRSS